MSKREAPTSLDLGEFIDFRVGSGKMLDESWSFRLTYWGTTGSFPRVMTPGDVRDRLVASLRGLYASGHIQEVLSHVDDEDEVTRRLIQLIPFDTCSSFGGNTTCIELHTPDSLFVVDAGSGLQSWSNSTQRRWNDHQYTGPREGHLFMTHAHLDHVCGLAYADTFHDPRNHFTIWGAAPVIDHITQLLDSRNDRGGFTLVPIDWDRLKGIRDVRPLPETGPLRIGEDEISFQALNHPGQSTAYRFDRDSKRIVIATDHEHADGPDETLAEFAAGADLLYLDGQYLQREYDGKTGTGHLPPCSRRGWGHSTVEASIHTAIAARANELHLGHHEPRRSDADLMRVEAHAQDYGRKLTESMMTEPIRIRLARESGVWSA